MTEDKNYYSWHLFLVYGKWEKQVSGPEEIDAIQWVSGIKHLTWCPTKSNCFQDVGSFSPGENKQSTGNYGVGGVFGLKSKGSIGQTEEEDSILE